MTGGPKKATFIFSLASCVDAGGGANWLVAQGHPPSATFLTILTRKGDIHIFSLAHWEPISGLRMAPGVSKPPWPHPPGGGLGTSHNISAPFLDSFPRRL